MTEDTEPTSEGAETPADDAPPAEEAAGPTAKEIESALEETALRARASSSPHLILNPVWLPPARGFAHAVVSAPGLVVYFGGQAGHRPDGSLAGETLVEQFDQACANLVEALAAAGGKPEHLVSIQIFVTDAGEYRSSLRQVGEVWPRHTGRHFPAMAL